MGSIAIIPIAAAGAIKLNKRIEDTMAPAMFFVVTVLYLSGLITFFLPGVNPSYLPGLWLLHITLFISLVYTISVFIRNRERFRASVVTCGLMAYCVFLVYFFLISYGRDPFMGDDLHRWAAAVRDYYENKYLTAAPGNLDSNYMYPPVLPLWNLYSVEMSGHFSDWMVFFSQNMLCGILALPMFKQLSPKDSKRNTILLSLAVILLPLITGIDMPYGNLHDAIPHGFLAAFIIWKGYEYHLSRNMFDLASALWAVCILTLTKEIAFATAMICIFVLFLNDLIADHSARHAGSAALKSLLLSACAILSWGSWQVYLNRQDEMLSAASSGSLVASRVLTASAFSESSGSTRLSAIIDRFSNMTSDRAVENWKAYTHLMTSSETAWLNQEGLLHLSTASFLLLLALAVYLSYRRHVKKSDSQPEHSTLRIAYLTLFLAVPLGLIARGIIYLTVTEFGIGVIFGAHTASYCVLAVLVPLYCMIRLVKGNQHFILATTCIFCLLIMHPLHPLMLILDKPQNTVLDCAKVAGIEFTSDDFIYRLSDSTAGFSVEDHDLVHYYAWPALNNQWPKYESLPSDADPEAYIMSRLSSTEATYLYTGSLSPAWQSALLPRLPGGRLTDYSLYRVEKTDGAATGLTFIGRDIPNAYSYRVYRYPPDLY